MKRWILVLGLLLSLGLNIGIFGTLLIKRSQARRAAAMVSAPGGPQLERVADRLGLEGEQRLRFVETQRRFMAEIRRGLRELETGRRALRQELGSPRPDPDRVRALVEENGRRTIELDLLFVDNVLYVRETLDGPGEQRYVRFLAQLYTRERGGPGAAQRRRNRGR